MTKQSTTQEAEKKPGLFDKIREFKEYVDLSKVEMRKVSWPTLKETRRTSLVVLGFVAVMVLFLGLVDLGFSKLIAIVLSA